jgi:hypothetical protein
MPSAVSSEVLYSEASNWIQFLRGYGPVPRNENMYDEFIRRSASRLGVAPLNFHHPARHAVLEAICGASPTSVVLTGTAGDGKTYLCRQVWEAVGADPGLWHSKDPLITTLILSHCGQRRAADGVLASATTDANEYAGQRRARVVVGR